MIVDYIYHLLSILNTRLYTHCHAHYIYNPLSPGSQMTQASYAPRWSRLFAYPYTAKAKALLLSSPIPRPILLLIRQLLGLLPLKHHIPPIHASPPHHPRRALIPPIAEHMHPDRLYRKSVHEPSQAKLLPARPLFGGFVVERAGFGLLEHEDAEAVVGGAFLRKGREPGEDCLSGGGEAGEGEGGAGRGDGDVDGEEVAAGFERVCFQIRDVRVHDHDCD